MTHSAVYACSAPIGNDTVTALRNNPVKLQHESLQTVAALFPSKTLMLADPVLHEKVHVPRYTLRALEKYSSDILDCFFKLVSPLRRL